MNKKLKPFDLEAALNGAEVVTLSGISVKEIVHLKTINQSRYPLAVNLDGSVEQYSLTGEFDLETSSSLDLFMKPTQVTKWVNIYKNSAGHHCGNHLYLTKEQALKNSEGAVDTIQITFED